MRNLTTNGGTHGRAHQKNVDQVGVSEEIAQKVVGVVSGFMKVKLPGGLGEQVNSLLSGGLSGMGDVAGKAGEIAKGLGDILGGKGKE